MHVFDYYIVSYFSALTVDYVNTQHGHGENEYEPEGGGGKGRGRGGKGMVMS